MLLRSITKNVKDQNWFAVALDFVIVFVGVFVGLQAQGWSDARALERLEQGYLLELRNEVEDNVFSAKVRANLMESVVESGERVLAFLERDEACSQRCWPILVDFFAATQVFFTPTSKTVYDEMLRLGLMRNPDVKEALRDYYITSESTYASFDIRPEFRMRVRELLSVPAQRVLWTDCHRIDGRGTETLLMDCPAGLPEKEIKDLLDTLRSDTSLKTSLNYWIGTHFVWLPVLDGLIGSGERAVRVLDSVLSEKQ